MLVLLYIFVLPQLLLVFLLLLSIADLLLQSFYYACGN